MADRLRGALGAIALCALIACQKTETVPPAISDVMALASKTTAAARGIERYYQAENDGVADAYVERALADNRAVGRTEACRLPTGATSTRATVLANPPLSAAAIRQRRTLVAAIGAYASTLAAVAEGSGADVVSASLVYAKSRASALQKAAGVHAQGDLFIADESSEFADAVAHIDRAGPKDALTRQLHLGGTLAQHLAAIAATDVARQRKDSIDATTLAYAMWASRVRGGGDSSHVDDTPFCSEPAIFRRAPSGRSSAPGTGAPDARGVRLRARMDAIRRTNPGSVLRALATLQEAELHLLASSGDAVQKKQVAVTRDRLEQTSEHFANASSAFVPASATREPLETKESR